MQLSILKHKHLTTKTVGFVVYYDKNRSVEFLAERPEELSTNVLKLAIVSPDKISFNIFAEKGSIVSDNLLSELEERSDADLIYNHKTFDDDTDESFDHSIVYGNRWVHITKIENVYEVINLAKAKHCSQEFPSIKNLPTNLNVIYKKIDNDEIYSAPFIQFFLKFRPMDVELELCKENPAYFFYKYIKIDKFHQQARTHINKLFDSFYKSKD